MKKLTAIILSLMLLLASVTAIAEAPVAPDQAELPVATGEDLAYTGLWYLNQIVMDGVAYDVSKTQEPQVIELKDNFTGTTYVLGNENSVVNVAWTKDETGSYWYTEETNSARVPMRIEEEALIIGTEEVTYILNKEQAKPVNFAKVVKAEDAKDFDGEYALTYLSGDEYTLAADKAMDDLAALGVKNTGITIEDSLVELFGNNPRAYIFDAENGTLNMQVDDNLEFLNVYINKTEDGGLAINWLNLTFYCDPVTEEGK